MHSFEIDHPLLQSGGRFDRWSANEDDQEQIVDMLRLHPVKITENTTAVDLASGDGAGALALVKYGFSPEKITCIGNYEPLEPFVDGVQWKYWDLVGFYRSLANGWLPENVEKMRNTFTVVLCLIHEIDIVEPNVDRICEFFVAPGGFILKTGSNYIQNPS